MTTSVKVTIQGNKACEVSIDGNDPETLEPGDTTTKEIHGEQSVCVCEVEDSSTNGGGGPPEENEPGP
jgi:hypothetical protein